MYVCMCSQKMWNDGFLFRFFSTVVFIDNFLPSLEKKNEKWWIFMYVCMCKAKSIIDRFFLVFSHAPFPKRFLSAWLYISGANMVNWVLNKLIFIKVNSISFCEFFWYWKSSIDHYAFLWAITTWVPFWARTTLLVSKISHFIWFGRSWFNETFDTPLILNILCFWTSNWKMK